MNRVTLRSVVRLGLVVAGGAVLPTLVAAGNVWLRLQRLDPAGGVPVSAAPLPPLPDHDPTRPTAVVLFSRRGTEITDALPPFAILAETGGLNTYAVAPERRAVPLYNASLRPAGVSLVPHLGFAEYEVVVGGPPDLVVVPYFPRWAPGTDDEVLAWLRAHVGPDTRVVTVCAGTEILAATGLLDGHRATSNPYWIPRLRERHASVTWLEDVRYVADGRMFTSTALTSGMDATLAALAHLLGRPVADATAQALAYPHGRFLDDPSYRRPSLSWGFMPDLLFARPGDVVPVVVAPGVDEIALSAILEVEAAPFRQTRVMASAGGVLRSARGLHLIAADLPEGPGAARAIWVGGDGAAPSPDVQGWVEQNGHRLDRPFAAGLFPYDAVVAHVGERAGSRMAVATAQSLAYPAPAVAPGRAGWPRGWWWLGFWALVGATVAGVATRPLTLRTPPSPPPPSTAPPP